MTPDLDKYMEYVDDFDLSEEAKRELLMALWGLLENFVDRAFGCDVTQQAMAAAAKNTGQDSGNSLVSDYNAKARRQEEPDGKDHDHDCRTQEGRHLRARFE